MIICVYALVGPPPARLRLTGIGGEKLRVVPVDRIAAIVGALRRAPAPHVTNLRRYAAVIEAIAGRVPAILPARFGTTVVDADELAFILRSRKPGFRQRLRAVRGRSQMTIRLLLEPDSRERSVASRTQTAPPARLRPADGAIQGTEYLQQRREMAAKAADVPGFAPIRAAVRRFVKDERIDTRAGVATINHLIPRTTAEGYRHAVERAAASLGTSVVVTGPFPPYAFADNW